MSVEVLKTSFLQVKFSEPKTLAFQSKKRAETFEKALKKRNFSEKAEINS